MDRVLKQRWLDALRGGKYQQARGQLRKNNVNGHLVGHCCLGVLCDLVNPKGWRNIDSEAFQLTPDGEITYYTLPYPLAQEINPGSTILDHLVQLNDVGQTFAEIADVIERDL